MKVTTFVSSLCLWFPLGASAAPAFLAHWQRVPATALPKLSPDGSLPDFRLALARQLENCADYAHGCLRHCGKERATFPLACDSAVLKKFSAIAGESASWAEVYAKAKVGFDWYRYRAGAKKVLFTGYNSPTFSASLKPGPKFKYPLYALPPDLVSVKDENGATHTRRKLADGALAPYYDRRAIEVDHALAGQGLELAYLESPADVLRLQIEGSGVLRVRGERGQISELGVNYAGKNGFPYVSVFKTLKKNKVDPKYLSFPGLKQYFLDHPEQMAPTLAESPSYVFFALAAEPPCGSARVHVTGGHSIAVDPTQLPLGLVAFLEAERPVEGTDPEAKIVPVKKFSRFALAQDTGGAIKGAHVDVYWGTDEYAMLASNSMSSRGNLYLPKLNAPPKSGNKAKKEGPPHSETPRLRALLP